ncbi:MAG: hypothetical protein ABL993_17190 [Vicinamibacterales bacterium]
MQPKLRSMTAAALTLGAALGCSLGSVDIVAAPAAAQEASQPSPSANTNAIDVDRLPIDLQRIERRLRQSSIREERDGLNLRFVVDVYGRAPRILLFTPADNLSSGPVPWGGPTHKDMLEVTTPKEFRAPIADFAAFMKWLSDKVK